MRLETGGGVGRVRGGDARGCGVGCGGGRRQDAVGVTDGVPWQVRAYVLT